MSYLGRSLSRHASQCKLEHYGKFCALSFCSVCGPYFNSHLELPSKLAAGLGEWGWGWGWGRKTALKTEVLAFFPSQVELFTLILLST